MRIIDADALINVILKDSKLDGINANWEVNRIIVHINNAPTVERPHGEWLPNYTSQFMNPGRQCSLCGKVVEFSENFCPKCGADMRGDDT